MLYYNVNVTIAINLLKYFCLYASNLNYASPFLSLFTLYFQANLLGVTWLGGLLKGKMLLRAPAMAAALSVVRWIKYACWYTVVIVDLIGVVAVSLG